AGRLSEIGLIERHEEPGVPSKVTHRLTDPDGQELLTLLEAYADASLTRLSSGEVDAHAWGSLGLLADLWEAGMIEALSYGPCSPTELARGDHGLSYHQVKRRTVLFAIGGFLQETCPARLPRRSYELTDKARRAMALIAGIGRWRHRNIVAEGEMGATAAEVAAMLRAALPLITLPDRAGKSFTFAVVPGGEANLREAELVGAKIDNDGAVLSCTEPAAEPDGWARGRVDPWMGELVNGPRKGLRLKGDTELLEACLAELHSSLWETARELSPVLA
ncbi:MAG: hypothetical protein ACTHK3_00165, partial [Solirubrobacterales bacterium]